MGLFESLEKLINERGSAAILREHLALVKAEYAAGARARADLQTQCDQLRTKNEQLEKDLQVLARQLQIRRARMLMGSHHEKGAP